MIDPNDKVVVSKDRLEQLLTYVDEVVDTCIGCPAHGGCTVLGFGGDCSTSLMKWLSSNPTRRVPGGKTDKEKLERLMGYLDGSIVTLEDRIAEADADVMEIKAKGTESPEASRQRSSLKEMIWTYCAFKEIRDYITKEGDK